MRRFWMIIGASCHSTQYRHESIESAWEECDRLCRANPGKEFIILESVERRKVPMPDVIKERRFDTEYEEIPF